MTTYESLLGKFAALDRPEKGSEREILWVGDGRHLGVCRNHQGRLEIFLVGSELDSNLPTVKDALEHGPWWFDGSTIPAFEANRLLLPAVGHFDPIAAFVCAELLRNDVQRDVHGAFKRTEPIIGLVIERLRLSDAAMLGLAGELLLVSTLCKLAKDSEVAQVVQNWDGWRRSFRDFTWGGTGVEIKTTSGTTSTHPVQGTQQIEPFDGAGLHKQEVGLILVSIGLRAAAMHTNSFTISGLVEVVVARLDEVSRSDVAEVFLHHVREYDAGSGFGYDHTTMRSDPSFTAPIETVFVRAYDMTDPNISVLRRADVTPHQHVDASSINFNLDLPESVSGSVNPIVGLNQAAAKILQSV